MPTKSAEYREMDLEELETRLVQSKQELFNLRFQVVTGRLDNTARIGQVKREVARILTILREREIAAAEALEASSRAATTGGQGPAAEEEVASDV